MQAARLPARGDVIGQAGIEATYDSYLRGRDGSAAAHRRLARAADEPDRAEGHAAPGQHAAAHARPRPPARRRAGAARRDQRSRTRTATWAADGGAIVALDPRDGSVLAMASYPTYEPSIYVSRDPTKLAPLQNDDARGREATSRASTARSTSRYPPGSTWKPVTALAAMQEHILTPYSSLPCTPDYKASTSQVFNNWDPYVEPAGSRCRRRSPSRATPTSTASGQDFYELPPSRGPCAPALGLALRLRRADRDRRRPRGGRARARRRSGARKHVQRPAVQRDRPDLEAGLLGPARDRPGRPRPSRRCRWRASTR